MQIQIEFDLLESKNKTVMENMPFRAGKLKVVVI